jgi:hypothetical protein
MRRYTPENVSHGLSFKEHQTFSGVAYRWWFVLLFSERTISSLIPYSEFSGQHDIQGSTNTTFKARPETPPNAAPAHHIGIIGHV